MAAKNQCLKKPKRKKAISLIRPMTMQDVPVLIAIGARMHQESTYSNLDYSPKKLMGLAEIITNNPDEYMCAVLEKNKEIIGFCVGFVTPHFFGHDLTSGDLLIYVLPEFRTGIHGVRLVRAYDEWCTEKGVKEPLLGVSAGITPERVGALYERMGYTEKYTIYKKPIK